jgi:hypothetical protein
MSELRRTDFKSQSPPKPARRFAVQLTSLVVEVAEDYDRVPHVARQCFDPRPRLGGVGPTAIDTSQDLLGDWTMRIVRLVDRTFVVRCDRVGIFGEAVYEPGSLTPRVHSALQRSLSSVASKLLTRSGARRSCVQ